MNPAIQIFFWILWSFLSFAQPNFTLNGSTLAMSENCYRLTSNVVKNDVGSLWSEVPIALKNELDIRFAVNLGCNSSYGDGMAFVFHADTNTLDYLGCPGAAMGFANAADCPALRTSLAIELDTRFNRSQKDIKEPHMCLVRDGLTSQPLTEPVPLKSHENNIRDCEYHDVRITWYPSSKELKVYYDNELRINYNGDLIQDLFNGQEEVYFGFTGSTGNRENMQVVCMHSIIMEVDQVHEKKLKFEEAVGIYINPMNEKVTVDLQLQEESRIKLQLYNAKGELIFEIPEHQAMHKKYHFNMPGLPSGVYYVTITDGENRVNKKIIHLSSVRA